MKEFYLKHTKSVIVSIFTLLVVCGVGIYVYLSSDKPLNFALKDDIKQGLTYEYGNKIEIFDTDFLALDDLDQKQKEVLLSNLKIENNLVMEENKDYPKVGEYTITFTYKDKVLSTNVVVKDTTKPVFNDISSLTFEEGTEFDFTTAGIEATDLTEVKLTYDDSAVNKEAAGTYNLLVTATDSNGNTEIKEIQVEVTAKPVIETPVEEPQAGGNIATPPNTDYSANQPSNDNSGSYQEPQNQPPAGNTGSTDNNVPDRTETACTPDKGNSGKLFNTQKEAEDWAEEQMDKDKYVTYRGYGGWSTCGKYTIHFKYK